MLAGKTIYPEGLNQHNNKCKLMEVDVAELGKTTSYFFRLDACACEPVSKISSYRIPPSFRWDGIASATVFPSPSFPRSLLVHSFRWPSSTRRTLCRCAAIRICRTSRRGKHPPSSHPLHYPMYSPSSTSFSFCPARDISKALPSACFYFLFSSSSSVSVCCGVCPCYEVYSGLVSLRGRPAITAPWSGISSS